MCTLIRDYDQKLPENETVTNFAFGPISAFRKSWRIQQPLLKYVSALLNTKFLNDAHQQGTDVTKHFVPRDVHSAFHDSFSSLVVNIYNQALSRIFQEHIVS